MTLRNIKFLENWINKYYIDENVISNLNKKFSSNAPFPFIELKDFFIEDKLDLVIEALQSQDFFPRLSDLFQFKQTDDLDELEGPVLKEFKKFISSSSFIDFMSNLSGIKLSNKRVDCLGNIYSNTDYLLCHDDQLPERAIAFIIYLTDLDKNEGGALNLFDNIIEGNRKYPKNIVKSLYPEYNKFTFFQVLPISFHEVGEVIGDDVFRVTLNGWYYYD